MSIIAASWAAVRPGPMSLLGQKRRFDSRPVEPAPHNRPGVGHHFAFVPLAEIQATFRGRAIAIVWISGGVVMKLPRRQFLHLAAGAAALPAVSRIAGAQSLSTKPVPEQSAHPLAETLAAYADSLRYDDLDAATIERVKSHVIDTLGCGIAAFDEEPVRICRDIVLATSGGGTGWYCAPGYQPWEMYAPVRSAYPSLYRHRISIRIVVRAA